MVHLPNPPDTRDLLAKIAAHLNMPPELEPMLREHACMKMVLDSMTDNFFALNHEWRYSYFNRRGEEQLRLLGKDPAKMIGKLLWDEFPYVPNESTYRRAMSERVALTDDLYYPPLGQWVENHVYPTDDGGLVIFQRYITERKEAEVRLRRSEAYQAESQKMSHTGSWVWNLQTKDLFWSDEHFRIFGFEPGAVVPTYELAISCVHPEERGAVEREFSAAVEKRDNYSRDCRIVRPNGEVRYIRSIARPELDATGELVEYIGTAMDVTERFEAEAALRRSQEALAHVTRALSLGELTSSIAHELNQPLAAIVANGSAALRWMDRDKPELEEVRSAVTSIIRDGTRAGEVLRRIRQFVQRGSPSKAPVAIGRLLYDANSSIQAEARASDVSIRMHVADKLPLVLADRVQLQQVVMNLMMNAIEAMVSLRGRPRILQIVADAPTAGEIRIAVTDSGEGFDPDKAKQIFNAFYTTKATGLGLGLAISRSVVEEHGGRLSASSQPGEGTTFELTLPIAGGKS